MQCLYLTLFPATPPQVEGLLGCNDGTTCDFRIDGWGCCNLGWHPLVETFRLKQTNQTLCVCVIILLHNIHVLVDAHQAATNTRSAQSAPQTTTCSATG